MNAAPWLAQAVAEFGRQLDIPELALDADGAFQLAFVDGGQFGLEPVCRAGENELLVYMARPVGSRAAALARPALERAHFKSGGQWPVQVALRGHGTESELTALTRIPERGLTAQALGQMMDYLARWLDEVQLAQP